LEERLAAREAVPPDAAIAERVLQLLAGKAARRRVRSNGTQAPGAISSALTAARTVQAFVAPPTDAPPGVAPASDETGLRAWLVTQVLGEFRLMALMYFDARYRLSRVAQFGVPLLLGLMVLNYLFLAALPLVGFLLERAILIVLAVVLYKLLAREALRYKRVLEYLTDYGAA
jgi:hypothetical protein